MVALTSVLENAMRYEVLIAGEWCRCQIATELACNGVLNGWLSWQMRDGTIGLSRPKKWRKVAKK